ncbi:exopolysaccharide Pel transporter PelG [Roseibium sp. CAU 1637]|uniref:Exopolysaccharide Pel transporter PelG n=1 Tax=Roseibium limicola TaxID=2816037 RepID=A0A939ELE7_9HYPH|nr:exopolysaccharide Pel transporter PelG [Roseibium limicola]
MAGITFELQKLAKAPSILGGLSAYGHSAVIVAGPWLFTVLAIAFITIATEQYLGLDALANFRIVLIYGFAISLVTTAPVVIVTTRMLSDMIFAQVYTAVSQLLFTSLVAGTLIAVLCAFPIFTVVFPLDPSMLPGALFCVAITAMIWIALVFCGAIKDFMAITLGFLIGLVLGIFLGLQATKAGYGTHGLLWSFNLGLSLTVFILLSRILVTFPTAMDSGLSSIRMLLSASRSHVILAVGATLAVTGIWIDKWVMWTSSSGERLPVGLIHAPFYDSAMFVANLAIIPGLAAFVLHLETGFYRHFKVFNHNIETHATLNNIKSAAANLQRATINTLMQIVLLQAIVCAIAIWLSPAIADSLNLQFRQIGVLRIGFLGVLFHFAFLASSSLLLFMNQSLKYFKLQAIFLLLNGVLTYAAVMLGPDFWGYGYMVGAMISSLLAVQSLYQELSRLPYTMFTMAATRSAENDWLMPFLKDRNKS